MDTVIIGIACLLVGGLITGIVAYLVANGKVGIATGALSTAKEFMEKYGEEVKEKLGVEVYNEAVAAITLMQTALEDEKLSIVEFAACMAEYGKIFQTIYSKFTAMKKAEAEGEE